MHAVSRLLESATGAGGPSTVAETLVAEARTFFRVSRAILLSVAELEGRLELAAMSPAGSPRDGFIPLTDVAPLARLLRSRESAVRLEADQARQLAAVLGAEGETVLLLPRRGPR